MKYTDFFENLDELYPESWDIEFFKNLTTFKARIGYSNQHLQRLAGGSARIVYKIDEEKVLKLARNRKGLAQNEAENDGAMQRMYGDIVTKLFEADENKLWVEMELVKKLTPTRFTALVGHTVETVGMYLRIRVAETNGKKTGLHLEKHTMAQLDENEWAQRVLSLCLDFNMQPADFGKISSFGEGTRDGKPSVIIVDMGFSSSVAKDFYGVN